MVTQTKQETRDSKPQENIKKFKEVLLYVLESIGARPNIGESVICKLMYFIDFEFFSVDGNGMVSYHFFEKLYRILQKEV